MAGHSKWHNIMHRKGRQDAKKGKLFTKAAKEIIIAARAGGGDPDMNARLRQAILAAKQVNLPKDKIENAIKKGTGELEGETYEEVNYEGYAPGGVAMLIECATDNRNRTVSEVRHALTKMGGSMGESGSVGWMFDRKGVFVFPKTVEEETLMEVGLEAGAEDVVDDGDAWSVQCPPEAFDALSTAFETAGVTPESAEVTMVPQNNIEVDEETGRKILKLLGMLDDLDDVQNVHANVDFPESLMAEMEG